MSIAVVFKVSEVVGSAASTIGSGLVTLVSRSASLVVNVVPGMSRTVVSRTAASGTTIAVRGGVTHALLKNGKVVQLVSGVKTVAGKSVRTSNMAATQGTQMKIKVATTLWPFVSFIFTLVVYIGVISILWPLLKYFVTAVGNKFVEIGKQVDEELKPGRDEFKSRPFARRVEWVKAFIVGLFLSLLQSFFRFVQLLWENRMELLIWLVIIFVFLLMEIQSDNMLTLMDGLWYVFVVLMNIFLGVLNKILTLLELTNPFTNAVTADSVHLVMTIVDQFGDKDRMDPMFQGRNLEEAELFSTKTLEAALADLIHLLTYFTVIYHEMLRIVTTVVLQIFVPIWQPLMNIMMNIAVKLSCLVAGGFACGPLEILDFYLVWQVDRINIVLSYLPLLSGIHIEYLNVGCPFKQLENQAVPCTCSGRLDNFDPPGFYRAMQPCSVTAGVGEDNNQARRLVECTYMHDSLWVEKVDGQTTMNEGCPLTIRALHPEQNVLNLHDWRADYTQPCYDICADHVLATVCQDWSNHTVTYKGSCGQNDTTSHPPEEGKRRLESFMGGGREFQFIHDQTQQFQANAGNQVYTMATFESQSKENFGTSKFKAGPWECNVHDPSLWDTNPTHQLYHSACLTYQWWNYFATASSSHHHRVLETKTVVRSHPVVDWALDLRSRARVFSTTSGSTLDKFTMAAAGHTSPLLMAFEKSKHVWTKLNTENPNPVESRRLEEEDDQLPPESGNVLLGKCLEDEYLCPNRRQCVPENSKASCEYDPNTDVSILDKTRQFVHDVSVRVESVDAYAIFQDVVQCWKDYKKYPVTYPLTHENIFAAPGKSKAVYCLPLWAPTEWRFERWEYSGIRKWVSSLCGKQALVRSCMCPQYYAGIFEWSDISWDVVTLTAETRFFNGLISSQFLFAEFINKVVVFTWVNVVWLAIWSTIELGFSTLNFGSPVLPKWWIHLFDADRYSSLSKDTEWFCYWYHFGSFAYFWFMIRMLFIVVYSAWPTVDFLVQKLIQPFTRPLTQMLIPRVFIEKA